MKQKLYLLLFFIFCPFTLLGQVVTTFAGSGAAGSTDASGAAASFRLPTKVVVDGSGNMYVADQGNQKIRKITSAGVVTTLAGSGVAGSTDGTGVAASFYAPRGVALDGSGNLYIADTFNNKIRKITSAGVVTTLAGTGAQGSTDAIGTAASFFNPYGVAVDGSGNVYVADAFNHKIRKITSAGVVTTFAGSGVAGNTDATGIAASFNAPFDVSFDSAGNLYVADRNNNSIRKITSAGVVTTLAGSGVAGSTNATGTAASFDSPRGVAVDGLGNVYVADYNNNKIRKITSTGVVTTLAGSGVIGSTDATGTAASFFSPYGVVVDGLGNVFVADTSNHKIRKIAPLPATHLNFDGLNDNVTIPATAINNLSQGTIQAWVYPTASVLDNQTICAKQKNGVNSYAILSIGGGAAPNGKLFYQSKKRSFITK